MNFTSWKLLVFQFNLPCLHIFVYDTSTGDSNVVKVTTGTCVGS